LVQGQKLKTATYVWSCYYHDMVSVTGDRGQAIFRPAEPFCPRLVSFLAGHVTFLFGHVTGQWPWYGLGRWGTGDRGQAIFRPAEPFCPRLVSFLAGHVTFLFGHVTGQ